MATSKGNLIHRKITRKKRYNEKRNTGGIKLLESYEKTIDKDLPLMIKNCSDDGLHHVLRTIFAYIETFGSAYGGYDESTTPKIEFIKIYFGEQDEQYKKFGGFLYSFCRHGLVHSLKPQHGLKIGNRSFYWLIDKSHNRPKTAKSGKIITYDQNVDYSTFYHNGNIYKHLNFSRIGSSRKIYVPISVDQFYLDLKEALKSYFHDLENQNRDKKTHDLRYNAGIATERIQTEVLYKSDTKLTLKQQKAAGKKIQQNRVYKISKFPELKVINQSFEPRELQDLAKFLSDSIKPVIRPAVPREGP